MPLVTTARVAPNGLEMEDGFPTTIAFQADPNIAFWEKTVTPPGLDGGDAIEQTTMHNDTLRTFAARSLITMTEMSLKAAWDPAVYDAILDLVNVEGSITVHFPNGDTLDFFGYLRVFEPQEMSEGEQPECQITIQPTNRDPVTHAETEPNWIGTAGSAG